MEAIPGGNVPEPGDITITRAKFTDSDAKWYFV